MSRPLALSLLAAVAMLPLSSGCNTLLGIDDVELRESTRNLQILVHYLRAYDEVGAEIEALDRADRRQTLGTDSLDDARFAALVEQAGADGDEDAFRYLYRRAQRERALWSTLLERPRR